MGIGTTTPGAKLEIDGEYNSPPLVTLKMTTTSWGTQDIFNNFRYISTQAAATDSSLKQFNVGAGGVSIGYGNVPIYGSSDALYVNGNVGIGTTSPGSKLDVNGTVKATSFSGGGSGLTGIPNSATTATSANTVSTIVARDGSGNSYFAGNTGIGFVQQGFYGDVSGNLATRPSPVGATFFQNYAGARTDMFIANNGYVGIGTTDPSWPLTVQNDANPYIVIKNSNGNYAALGRSGGALILSLNNAGNGNHYISYDGDSNLDFPSDRRLKKDIVDAEPVLDRAMQVQVRRFRWKENDASSKHMIGVIAQELQPLFPEMVKEFENPTTKEKNLTVSSGDFAVIAIKSLQEFKQQHDVEMAKLKAELAELARENQKLEAGNQERDKRLAAVEQFMASQSRTVGVQTPSPR